MWKIAHLHSFAYIMNFEVPSKKEKEKKKKNRLFILFSVGLLNFVSGGVLLFSLCLGLRL